ncbi:MAG: hypothetical protein IJO61_05635 [Oscillospiraceae bacterium]|nr:hypothetical protein [Oscillospiraceae bacterium]
MSSNYGQNIMSDNNAEVPVKKSKNGMIIAIVVLVLVIIAAISAAVYFGLSSMKDSEEGEETVITSEVHNNDEASDIEAEKAQETKAFEEKGKKDNSADDKISGLVSSSDIDLENEDAPNPKELPHYKFMKENCEKGKEEKWETLEAAGKYAYPHQKESKEIKGAHIIFPVEFSTTNGPIKEEEFNDTVRILKDRLEIIGEDYAIGYSISSYEETPIILVKIGTKKMGQPILSMLGYYAERDAYNTKLVSQMGDQTVENVIDFSYDMNSNGEYEISLSMESAKISAHRNELLAEYIKNNVGKNLYWQLAGDITIAAIPITNDFSTDEMKFTEFMCLNNKKLTKEDLFVVKLLYTVLQGEQYPTKVSVNELNCKFSVGDDVSSFGYGLYTPVDESLEKSAKEIFGNVKVYKQLGSPQDITVKVFYDVGAFTVSAFMDSVKKLYQQNPNISAGSYRYVKVEAEEKRSNSTSYRSIANVKFCKDTYAGKVEISYVYGYEPAHKEAIKTYIKNDPELSGIAGSYVLE